MRSRSIMDNDATQEERQQFEKIEAENQRILDEQEREISAVTGSGAYNVFDGTDAHVPLTWSEAEEARCTKLAEQASERFPDFREVFRDYALPTIQRNTRLFRRLLEQKDPALEVYALGLLMRQEEAAKWRAQEYHPARALTQNEIDSMNSGEELEERLAEMRNAGPEEAPPSEYLSDDERRQMNELHPGGFEICLDWVKRNRG